MFMIEYRDIGWWYWLVTAVLLSFGILGNPAGFILAIGLTTIQLIHYVIRERSMGVLEILCHFFSIVIKRNDTCLNNLISIKPWLPCRMVKT